MFDGFARLWTPLIEMRRIKNKPVCVQLAGEPLVLFRGLDGTIGALIDRCPHRGVALSLGSVGADGCLECPFHGWRFDTTGANRHVPLNPDAKRGLLGATALPVRQIGEMVWVYTAPVAEAPEEPVAPDGLSNPGLSRIYLECTWKCHWTRAMENMLDTPHLPFVHRNSIGRMLRDRLSTESRMDIEWDQTAWGGRARALMDGKGGAGMLEFHKPNMMALHISIPGRHMRIHSLVTPIDSETTRLMLVTSRDFARSSLLNPIFSRSNLRIANEDRQVVESSQPPEIPPPGVERSVRTDQATLAFRKYYYDTLRASAA